MFLDGGEKRGGGQDAVGTDEAVELDPEGGEGDDVDDGESAQEKPRAGGEAIATVRGRELNGTERTNRMNGR